MSRYHFWFTTFQRDGWDDSYADGLSGVWAVVADAIHDESFGMDDRDIRSMTFAVVRAYRDYMDALTEEER